MERRRGGREGGRRGRKEGRKERERERGRKGEGEGGEDAYLLPRLTIANNSSLDPSCHPGTSVYIIYV